MSRAKTPAELRRRARYLHGQAATCSTPALARALELRAERLTAETTTKRPRVRS